MLAEIFCFFFALSHLTECKLLVVWTVVGDVLSCQSCWMLFM